MLNRVIRPGGLLFIATHPTWPPHVLPADYWRFHRAAFHSLLNAATGFEIVALDEGLPARMVSLVDEVSLHALYRYNSPLGVAVLARRTGDHDPALAWAVAPPTLSDVGSYPIDDRSVDLVARTLERLRAVRPRRATPRTH